MNAFQTFLQLTCGYENPTCIMTKVGMSAVIVRHCHQVITNAYIMLKQGLKKNKKTGHLNERFSDLPAAHVWLPKSNFYYQISRYEQCDWGTLSSNHHKCTYNA